MQLAPHATLPSAPSAISARWPVHALVTLEIVQVDAVGTGGIQLRRIRQNKTLAFALRSAAASSLPARPGFWLRWCSEQQ